LQTYILFLASPQLSPEFSILSLYIFTLILNYLPISFHFHYSLRGRFTLRSLPSRRNPSTFGDNFFLLFFVTHISILIIDISTLFSQKSLNLQYVPLPYLLLVFTASAYYSSLFTSSVISNYTSELLRFL